MKKRSTHTQKIENDTFWKIKNHNVLCLSSCTDMHLLPLFIGFYLRHATKNKNKTNESSKEVNPTPIQRPSK